MPHDDRVEMDFLDHLGELRRRLILCLIVVLVASAASYAFADRLLDLLLAPSGGLRLKGFNIMDGFTIKLDISIFCGICVSFPVLAYHLLAFVGPAFGPIARRRAFAFVVSSFLLFAAGIAFGYSLLGMMIRVLTRLFPPQIEYIPSASSYVSFVGFFLLACGIAFELPCVLVLLVSLRILDATRLRKGRRIAWFLLFAFAELITPVSDPIFAPLLVMLPLVALFEASVLIARRIDARRDEVRGLKGMSVSPNDSQALASPRFDGTDL
jgi:sec-independent protein translocase protein TatC